MSKLTLEMKKIIVGTNHYTGKYNNRIKEDAYNGSDAYEILDVWLSEILEVDFVNDVYNNKEVSAFNRTDSVKKSISEKYGAWFIGDALKGSIYDLCHKNAQDDDDILRKEYELKDMWLYFNSLRPSSDLMEIRVKRLEDKLERLTKVLENKFNI